MPGSHLGLRLVGHFRGIHGVFQSVGGAADVLVRDFVEAFVDACDAFSAIE